MKTIAILSPVGGAGRTTVTAALASLLVARDHPVLALECDPRNLLGLHFGMPQPATAGLAGAVHSDDDNAWAAAGLRSDDDVLLLPWGDGERLEGGEDAAARALLAQPHWLRDRLALVDLPPDGVVLIDTPAWPSPHGSQAIHAADLALVLMPPEPELCATLTRLFAALQRAGVGARFVATRVQAARQLHTDTLALLRATLGEAMLPYLVHLDVGMPEALARGENFCRSTPHSQAAHDLQGIAAWLSRWVREAVQADTANGAGRRAGARG